MNPQCPLGPLVSALNPRDQPLKVATTTIIEISTILCNHVLAITITVFLPQGGVHSRNPSWYASSFESWIASATNAPPNRPAPTPNAAPPAIMPMLLPPDFLYPPCCPP